MSDQPPFRRLLRYAPILLLAAGFAAFFATGANRYVSLDWLRDNYGTVRSFVADHFAQALAIFMLVYVAATAFSVPGASFLSLAGGLLFGNLAGTAAVVVAATVGATLIFLAARTAFGDQLRRRAGPFISKFEEGFSRDGFSYLLLLRLVPAFPFFIVNLAPAFTRIRTSTYVAATFLGIIPGSFAYVSAGRGLGSVFESGGKVSVGGLLTRPEILTPIAALSLLALLPIALRALKARRPTT